MPVTHYHEPTETERCALCGGPGPTTQLTLWYPKQEVSFHPGCAHDVGQLLYAIPRVAHA